MLVRASVISRILVYPTDTWDHLRFEEHMAEEKIQFFAKPDGAGPWFIPVQELARTWD